MKLLILTQYFPPEIGAPQNRLFELALRIQKEGIEVNALTAMPNYPHMVVHKDYKGTFSSSEMMQGIKVHRRWIYVSKKTGIIHRLLNYFSFVFTSLFAGIFSVKKHDLILCESPPLFLGISAYIICKIRGSKLIFNVSDLWPESAEKLGIVTNKSMLALATTLEEFLYKSSVLVTGQTQGIVQDISSRFPNKKVYWLPNGVDLTLFSPDEVQSDFREKHDFSNSDLLFFYAGILGIAQGLDVIVDAAKRIADKNVKIVFLGEGPEKKRLKKRVESESISNVFFIDAITKAEMPAFVKAMDVSIVPLRRLDLFKGAIPSKIFENLAMKKPILLGVEGEAKELFIEEGKSGMFFTPENDEELAKCISEISSAPEIVLDFGENGRNYVDKKFNRNNIAQAFNEQLKELR